MNCVLCSRHYLYYNYKAAKSNKGIDDKLYDIYIYADCQYASLTDRQNIVLIMFAFLSDRYLRKQLDAVDFSFETNI